MKVGFYGVTNLIETWSVFIRVTLVAYYFYDYHRGKKPSEIEPTAEPWGEVAPWVVLAGGGWWGEFMLAGVAAVLFLGA